MTRDETIARIRKGLKDRSGKPWSVSGGRGTGWGWIRITSPPKRAKDQWGNMTDEERAELGKLLGLEAPSHYQGENVPDSDAYYAEYVDRAEGRKPTQFGSRYWD